MEVAIAAFARAECWRCHWTTMTVRDVGVGKEYQDVDTIFRPTKRGAVFKIDTGKLYLFAPGSITVMQSWPPMAWKKTRSNLRWVHLRPKVLLPCGNLEGRIEHLSAPADENGQLLLPFYADETQRLWRADIAWLSWSARIPEHVREVVARFPDRQWHLLSFIARCGDAAIDLVLANPALAWALASNWAFHRPPVQRPMRSARALLKPGNKQKDILAWLGFPEAEAARKVLRKIAHKAINVPSLLYLQQSMTDPAVAKVLAHLPPPINAGALRIVTDPGLLPFAGPTLVGEVSFKREEDERPKAAYLLQDSLNMFRLLYRGQGRFPHLKSLARLAEFHDSLVDEMGHIQLHDLDLALPPVPVKGTGTIIPLTTARDLIEEGRLQRNCIASYIERVAIQQRLYIYRMTFPERCTLSIMKRGAKWVLCELKRTCNLPAAETTRQAVLEWLSQSQSAVSTAGCLRVEDEKWMPEQDECMVAGDGPLTEPPDDGIPF